MIKIFISVLINLLILNISFGQEIISGAQYPFPNFRYPLNINPLSNVGSFGELRSQHFHTGVDFGTNKVEGHPVFAVEDGYISRIRIQSGGLGYSIYINHPNGYTSVYAHLQKFTPSFNSRIKSEQYKIKSYEVDLTPKAHELQITKGTLIGYSGNTGSSMGPHLHFEIRDTKSEEPINPNFFGIKVADNINPTISGLYIYELNGKPFTESTPKIAYSVIGQNGVYTLKSNSEINIFGEIGFGIIATDKHSGVSGLNGIYSIILEVDNQIVFKSVFERLNFNYSRTLFSYIDYPLKIKSGITVQKSFKDPGNPAEIFGNLINNGRLNFTDGKIHQIKYIVLDASGNKSTLSFKINAKQSNQNSKKITTDAEERLFYFDKKNEFITPNAKVQLSENSIFDNINFQYNTKPKPNNSFFSVIHSIHNPFTPVYKAFDLSIKPDASIGEFINKAVIVNSKGVSQGGTIEGEFLKASVKLFDDFAIKIDTIAPTITPLNISEGKNMKGIPKISLKIKDDLSGIKNYNGYIDGNWVLMEFDAKSTNIWHVFDKLSPGKHKFELVVEDMKANIKFYTVNFIR